MWAFILDVGLKLIQLFFKNQAKREEMAISFYNWIDTHSGDGKIPASKRNEFLLNLKKLNEEKDGTP